MRCTTESPGTCDGTSRQTHSTGVVLEKGGTLATQLHDLIIEQHGDTNRQCFYSSHGQVAYQGRRVLRKPCSGDRGMSPLAESNSPRSLGHSVAMDTRHPPLLEASNRGRLQRGGAMRARSAVNKRKAKDLERGKRTATTHDINVRRLANAQQGRTQSNAQIDAGRGQCTGRNCA